MNEETQQQIVNLCNGTEGKKGIGWPVRRGCKMATSNYPQADGVCRWYMYEHDGSEAVDTDLAEAYFKEFLAGKLVEVQVCEGKDECIVIFRTTLGTQVRKYFNNNPHKLIKQWDVISENVNHLIALLGAAKAVL